MNTPQRTTACKSCPFSKTSERGGLGGSPVETYLGQIVGPFFLPCHSVKDYKGNDEKIGTCSCQCAGAAIFRANLGLDEYMPDALLHLPAHSDENVFDTLVGFIEHHRPYITQDEAIDLVDRIEEFFSKEMTTAIAKHGIQKV